MASARTAADASSPSATCSTFPFSPAAIFSAAAASGEFIRASRCAVPGGGGEKFRPGSTAFAFFTRASRTALTRSAFLAPLRRRWLGHASNSSKASFSLATVSLDGSSAFAASLSGAQWLTNGAAARFDASMRFTLASGSVAGAGGGWHASHA